MANGHFRGDGIEYSAQTYDVQTAVVEASSSGDNEVVAAISGKTIIVVAYSLVAEADVSAKFESGTTSDVAISGNYSLAANGGIQRGLNATGYFRTEVGESLNLVLSAAETVNGEVNYIAVEQ